MSKSIRSVLDKLAVDAMFHGQNPEGNSKPSVDQALKDIAQIIDEAKPEQPTRYDDMDDKTDYHKRGYKLGIDQFKSNLREALGL